MTHLAASKKRSISSSVLYACGLTRTRSARLFTITPAARHRFTTSPGGSRRVNQRHDAGLLAGQAAAEDLQPRDERPVAQVIGQFQHAPFDRRRCRRSSSSSRLAPRAVMPGTL